jgi:hypothetical protein
MFWRKKEDSDKIPATTKYIAGLIADVDDIKERLKQLECKHGMFEFFEHYISEYDMNGVIHHTKVYGKKCTACGKIEKLTECEWLKQKHKKFKAIADATAKEMKECKP